MILEGKRILVTGVLTRHSIAYAVAEQAQLAGADIVLTSFGRMRRMTERAARNLPATPDIVELDVSHEADWQPLADDLARRWDGIDGVLHSIAFAPPDALSGGFMSTPPESAATAFKISAYSLKALTNAVMPLFDAAGGGSVVGLDFDASLAWPVYDWMGVSKAALEATSRYLARYVGPRGVRVNLVAAGPIATAAAQGISGFDSLAQAWAAQAPLGWDPNDPLPVARAICFLMSDWGSGISGEIIHVDGGYHAMGGPLEENLRALAAGLPVEVVA